MEFYGSNNEHYITGRELGRGGEGVVYELQNDGSRVLKHYTEPLQPRHVQKLHKMVSMLTPQVEAYAAWPLALVRDKEGVVCGFVMKKLTGFMPLHMIFSPMDRKRLFPDKGYNFLVHVARNLATAFHKLHDASLVVGDVNEGNILINANGLIAFIDCDSFQVKGDDDYFYCEVGVPRYTPPELLQLQSFDRVVRTTNTDGFSMAVLIFQLLFMGRHPFAGRNNTSHDIDEEAAIKMGEFAYSLTKRSRKLSPPKDSFPLQALTQPLSDNFHRAFETAERPSDPEWINALDSFLLQMVTCGQSRIHVYPSTLGSCPWCTFRAERGIMYFLDDSYIKVGAQLADIEAFVNGFRIEQLAVKHWDGLWQPPAVAAIPLPSYMYRRQFVHWFFVGLFLVISMLPLFFSIYILVVLGLAFTALFHLRLSPVARDAVSRISLRKAEIADLDKKIIAAIERYNNPQDMASYREATEKLLNRVERYRKLPEEEDRLKLEMEERLYNAQLDLFLRQFSIQSHTIKSFGAAKKNLLLLAGIRNAADISLLRTQNVPGIGPKNQQILFDWQRQMAENFTYIPDIDRIATGLLQVKVDLDTLRQGLENDIRAEYQAVNYRKQTIYNQLPVLESRIKDMLQHKAQSLADLAMLKQFASGMRV